MIKIVRLLIVISTAFLLFTNPVFAVETKIFDHPATITQEPFTIKLSVSGAKEGTNYLRVDLYKKDTTSYFGQTYSGSQWYDGSEATSYFPIQIVSGTDWSGELQAQLPDPLPSNYSGPGEYMMRVRRYTGSGNYSADEANANAVTVAINLVPSSQASQTPQEEVPQQTPQSTSISSAGPSYDEVYLSEAMVYPQSGEHEWVELYNGNEFAVTLVDWQIDDGADQGSAPKTFNLTMSARDYGVYEVSSAIFNNSGDTVRLIDSAGKVVDSFIFESAKTNMSLARESYGSGPFCNQNPSRGVANGKCVSETNKNNKENEPSATTSKPSERITQKATLTKSTTQSAKPRSKKPTDTLPFILQTTPGGRQLVLGITDDEKQPVLPENGAILRWLRTLTSAAAGISLLNMVYILNKMRAKLR